jgi:hypothetical protein
MRPGRNPAKAIVGTIVLLLAFSLSGMSPLHAQPALPDTPAGRMLGMWLAAFNSNDEAVVRKFYQEHIPRLPAAVGVGFRAQTGGVDIIAVKDIDPLRVIFLAKDRKTPITGLAVMTLSSTDPARITSLSFRGGMPPGTELTGFAIDAAMQARVIDGAVAALNESYVDPAVAKAMESDLRARLTKGEFAKITDGATFATALTDAMRAISRDKHLGVAFVPAKLPPPPPPPASPPPAAPAPEQWTAARCGYAPATQLPGRIGLIKFNGFASPLVCRDAASAMLNSLGEVDAIIFDLRDNGGGDPAMVAYMASYLFADRTHVTDIWTRTTDQTREFWTEAQVPGNRYAKQPVFILTSTRTFSGAEDFSYSLQALKRAVIVGEVTGGGAHPVRGQPLVGGFSIGVPYAKTVNPITKSNWEGTGVAPDVRVTAAEALAAAQKLATEAAARKD